MKLNANALGLASAIFCGVACLAIVLVNLWTGFAPAYIAMLAALEPGFIVGTYSSAVVALLYGLIAGYIGAYIFGWLYNQLTGGKK